MLLHIALFFILIGSVLNMWSTEGVSSTIRNTLFHKTKQKNVTMFVKLVCCQDFLLLFLTFNKTIFCLNSRSVFKVVWLTFMVSYFLFFFLWPWLPFFTLFFPDFSSKWQYAHDFELLNWNKAYIIIYHSCVSQKIRWSKTYCLYYFLFSVLKV